MTAPSENGDSPAAAWRWRARREAQSRPVDYLAPTALAPLGDGRNTGDEARIRRSRLQGHGQFTKSLMNTCSAPLALTGRVLDPRAASGVIPPTINLDNPGEGCDLDFVPNVARQKKIDVAMSNGFGFGGTNGTLVFKRL
jgi:3-oxoacyl-[acyl-carrier-protein] synthase II